MRVAFIVPALSKKGPIIVVKNIVNSIINNCDKIVVYYFDETQDKLDFNCETIKITEDSSIPFNDYDIVHSHGYRPEKYLYKWRKHKGNAKTVVTIHCDIKVDLRYTYNKLISAIFTPIWLFYISKIDYKVVISEKLRLTYENKFNDLYKIYNGVNLFNLEISSEDLLLNKFFEIKNKGNKSLYTYAVLTKRKGIDQLLLLLNKRNDLDLIIVGEGKEKNKLKEMVRDHSLEDRVSFFNFIDSPYRYIKYSDIFVMPSRSEGFGLALVEAALANGNIVCSDIDVFMELFDDSQVSFFKLEDIISLSNAIDIAIKNKCIKAKNSYSIATKKYISEIMGKNYLKLYKNILG